MCEECRQSPHNSSCPNAPDPKEIFYCKHCEEPIVEGEDYYSCGDDHYCLKCVVVKTAEEEE